MQDDGTVQMEVPEGIQPESFHFETDVLEDGAVDEPLDTPNVPVIPPLQIVMLIVGTRGDVQPFVAIGRRLQVLLTFPVFFWLKKVVKINNFVVYGFIDCSPILPWEDGV